MTDLQKFEPKPAVLIAGPTASGKSALAIEIAGACGGYIVNADSMQVYEVLRVVTARPDDHELALVDHHMYGHVHPSVDYSVGRWKDDVEALLKRDELQGRTPVFVGGTGMYFRALIGGLSQMPPVPDDVRQKWRERLASEGPEALHPLLLASDAKAGARIKPQDGQRIIRALEIHEASGMPISHWQERGTPPLIDLDNSRRICLLPDRDLLDVRIVRRLQMMVDKGALGEVEALAALRLHPALPAVKAIGVPEFLAHLKGETTLEEALARAAITTRQYAKRQSTWFRNQLDNSWSYLTGEN